MKVTNLLHKFKEIATIDLRQDEGEDKRLPLDEAIKRHVTAGMVLYIREGAYAAIREMIRQFRGTKPAWTLAMIGCRDYALDLLHCGLVTRVLTSRCSESATQGISAVVKRVYKQKSVEVENWSLYSLTLRMMAGAMGVGFMPTRSLIGSTMAQENKGSFVESYDPFGGDKVGMVKALHPDIALVHGWASDRNGNLILAPSILAGEGEWGAFASKKGVVATVEQIVSTEFIRKHAALVNIPGHFVRSVSLVPFGAHPLGLAQVANEFEEYEADYEFMKAHGEASKSAATLDAWLDEWMMDCPTNDDYLRKLGYPRLAFLKGKSGRFPWEQKVLSLSEEALTSDPCTSEERMIVAASRIIKEKIRKHGYRIILSGIGTAGLAAWLAYYQLKESGLDVELMLGSSQFGWSPRPGDPQVTNFSNLRTCKMITDILHTYGVFANRQCIAVLGTAQIDRYGGINSTRLSDDFFLTGSGGANDAVAAAEETVVVVSQSVKRFVRDLPYVTCSGIKTRTVISDQGVFEKDNGDEELILTGYLVDPGQTEQSEILTRIIANCGWELKVRPELTKVDLPTVSELALLRLLSFTSGG
jgi:acyl CoA:acetate/3-ketoacid CoA transferase alpha subunit